MVSRGFMLPETWVTGRTLTRGLLVALTALLTTLTACGGGAPPEGQAQAAARYAALDALPDWSGTWANELESTSAGMQDCCLGDGNHIPFTPQYAEVRRKIGQGEAERPGGSNANNSASCMPAGVPAVMAHPILLEFLFTPDRVTMIFNDGEIRSIDTASAAHPPLDEIEASFSGHSIGRWEGSALVVDTVAIDPRADIFMSNGIKVTAATQVTERFQLDTPERLRVDTTLTDAAIFTRPFSYTRYFQRVPGGFAPGCAANNIDDGVTVKDLEALP